jgi:hypothetical protein
MLVHILGKHSWAKNLKLLVVESFALFSTWQELGAQAPSCFATDDRSVHTESIQIQVIELSNHWMQELNNVGDAPQPLAARSKMQEFSDAKKNLFKCKCWD